MFSRSLQTSSRALRSSTPSTVRFASTLPVPPKVATPQSVAGGPGGDSVRMQAVVDFYKSLPKGDAPSKRGGGLKARFFDGKNASGGPILATIGGLMLLGYTIEYNGHLSEYPIERPGLAARGIGRNRH